MTEDVCTLDEIEAAWDNGEIFWLHDTPVWDTPKVERDTHGRLLWLHANGARTDSPNSNRKDKPMTDTITADGLAEIANRARKVVRTYQVWPELDPDEDFTPTKIHLSYTTEQASNRPALCALAVAEALARAAAIRKARGLPDRNFDDGGVMLVEEHASTRSISGG